MAIGKKKATFNVMASALVIIFTIFGPVIGSLTASGWNEWTSGGSLEYGQIENTTAYLSAPFVEEKISTKGSYASVNGTGSSANITTETPLWDVTTDWDQVTITSTGTDVRLIFNVNITLDDLMAEKHTELRMKTNGTKALDITVQAVKSDGVELTTYDLYTGEAANLSQVTTWSFDGHDILMAAATLDPAKTDDTWIRIIVEGQDTVKLTTADTLQFQFAWGYNGNVYALTHASVLGITAVMLAIVYIIVGLVATPFINLDGTGSAQRAGAKIARGKGRKRSTRGSMGVLPVVAMAGLAFLAFFTLDAAALPEAGTTAQAGGTIDPLFIGIAGSFLFIGAWAFMLFSGVTKSLPKKFSVAGFTISTGTGVLGTFLATATDTSTFVTAAFLGQLGWQGWLFAGAYVFFIIVLVWNGIYCWRKKKPFSLVR